MNFSSGMHPGVFLKQALDERGWSQTDLVFVLGCSPKSVHLMIAGKQGISPEMSKALGDALGVPGDYFADLQKAHEIALAANPNPSVALRAKMRSNYPIREMIKRGWLKDGDASTLQDQLIKFFGVSCADEIPYLAHAAKKSRYEEKEIPPAQLAWLFRVKQMAKSISVPAYSPEALQKAIPRLKEMLIAPEETRHVPRVLAECGVRFIIVESLPKSGIDGVCFWLSETKPVIGISTRYDRIDNFWFVIRHEIEHVLQGHGKDIPEGMIDAELEGEKASVSANIPEEERLANSAAANFCVPSEKIDSFMKRKHPLYYEKDVIAFSKLNNIHPGLVVGQMQHRMNRYDYLRNHLVKIRQFVLPGSIADGWGQTIPISA